MFASMYSSEGFGIGDLIGFDLNDLILGRLLDVGDALSLNLDQIDILRANVRSEILYSEAVFGLLNKRVIEMLEGLDIGPGGKLGTPGGRMYGEEPFRDLFEDFILERFLSPQQAASLSQMQLRALSARLKSDILFSDEIQNRLRERVMASMQEFGTTGRKTTGRKGKG
jgi:hypothetical protein